MKQVCALVAMTYSETSSALCGRRREAAGSWRQGACGRQQHAGAAASWAGVETEGGHYKHTKTHTNTHTQTHTNITHSCACIFVSCWGTGFVGDCGYTRVFSLRLCLSSRRLQLSECNALECNSSGCNGRAARSSSRRGSTACVGGSRRELRGRLPGGCTQGVGPHLPILSQKGWGEIVSRAGREMWWESAISEGQGC